MNREKFLRELAFLLQDIDDEERKDALNYYADYFDEAGINNESQVILELGSPERVAAIIKAGINNHFEQDVEFSEKGMDNSFYKENKDIIEAKIVEKDEEGKENKSRFKGDPDRNKILLILIIIGVVIIGLPAIGSIFGVSIGIFGGACAVLLAIMCSSVGCLAGAIACFVKGIMFLSATPGAGLITLGVGFGLIALSIIFGFIIRLIIKLLIKFIRWIVDTIQNNEKKGGDR